MESILPEVSFQAALDEVEALQQSLQCYNGAVDTCNALIKEQKRAAQQGGNIKVLNEELTKLEANKKRFQTEVVEACDKFQDALSQKRDLEKKKIKLGSS